MLGIVKHQSANVAVNYRTVIGQLLPIEEVPKRHPPLLLSLPTHSSLQPAPAKHAHDTARCVGDGGCVITRMRFRNALRAVAVDIQSIGAR